MRKRIWYLLILIIFCNSGFSQDITIQFSVTNPSCYGLSNASINSSISGNFPPFSIIWSNGQTTEDLNSLQAGNYYLTITDSNNSVYIDSVIIAQPQQLTNQLNVTYSNCFGNINLSINGGTSPYSFLWSNNATTEDIGNINASGLYSVTISDNNNCIINTSVTIPQNIFNVTASFNILPLSCYGSCNGAVLVSGIGGTSPYQYSNISSTGPFQSNQLFSGLCTGSYTFWIKDNHGCLVSYPININQPAILAINSIVDNVSCLGFGDGSINNIITGGTTPYTYIWDNGFSTEDLNNLIPGTYCVTVTDIKNCKTNSCVTITEPLQSLSTTYNIIEVNCLTANSGTINLSVTGGTSPYYFNWSNSQTTEDLVNITAGNYSVTVSDFNGCVNLFSFILINPVPAEIESIVQPLTCFEIENGSIDISVISGNSPYIYNWSNNATNQDLNNLAQGIYYLTLTYNQNCESFFSFFVDQPSQFNINATIHDITCFGFNNGSIDLTVSNGNYPYTFLWIPGNDTTEDLQNLSSGYYAVQVTDSSACSNSAIFYISEPELLSFSYILSNPNCSYFNDGFIDISVFGGTVPYNYQWSNNQITEDISLLEGGIYNVTITDFNNCSKDTSFSIYQPDSMYIDAYIYNPECFGYETGNINIDIHGGTQPYIETHWSNNETSEDISNLSVGNYQITITDSNNCSISASYIITQPEPLETYSSYENPTCFGYNNGFINLSVTGGITPYSFLWNNNETTEDISALFAQINTLYIVTITDNNSCIVSDSFLLSQPELLSVFSSHIDLQCYGNSDGSITLLTSGGSSPYSFIWSNYENTSEINSLSAGTYIYSVTDINNCLSTDSISILQPEEILCEAIIANPTCIYAQNGTITLNPIGGIPPYTIIWQDYQTVLQLINLNSGIYSLQVSDQNGCQKTFEYIIENSDEPCLEIPNVFTPNDDSYNDFWVISGLENVPGTEVKVFDRWNRMVYKTGNPYEPWNGKFDGENCPTDAYLYIIEYYNGLKPITGKVSIIR